MWPDQVSNQGPLTLSQTCYRLHHTARQKIPPNDYHIYLVINNPKDQDQSYIPFSSMKFFV